MASATVPPNDLAAEAAVLSACMLSAEALDEVTGMLRPEHYYSPDHQAVWSAVLDLVRAGSPVDVVTVAGLLRDRSAGGRIGIDELGRIVDATPAVAHVVQHAERVVSKWRLRSLIAQCQRIAAEAYDAADVAATLDSAESAIAAIAEDHDETEGVLLADAVGPVYTKIRAMSESGGSQLLGLPTGLRALDNRTSGLQRGDLTVIAARPGMGKSALAVGVALAAAEHGWVSLHSLEMPTEQVVQRMIAARADVDLAEMRAGRVRDSWWVRLQDACERLRALPVVTDDGAATTLLQLRRRARRVRRRAQRSGSDLVLIVVDYLQLMRGEQRRGASRENEVSELSRGLKALAKDLRVPVVALSQLSRRCEERKPQRPQLSDLRESGAIEQDADNVLFLYRSGYYLEQSGKVDDTDGASEVIVAKQRNGPTGRLKARWWSASATYTDDDSATPERTEYEENPWHH